MKHFLKYCLTLCFLLLLQFSFAAIVTEGKGETKTDETQTQQQQAESAKPLESSEEFVGGISGEEEAEMDSIVDDSVSKYNFILYFLYKFKYEEEE